MRAGWEEAVNPNSGVMRSELLTLSMAFTRVSTSTQYLLTRKGENEASNVPSFNGLGISISEKSKLVTLCRS